MNNKKSAEQLATAMVGDGQKPNMYFITLSFGEYQPMSEDPEDYLDMIQVKNALEPVTIGPIRSRKYAEQLYNSLALTSTDKVTGDMLTMVSIEDRLNGLVKDKYLKQIRQYAFRECSW